MKIAGAWLDHPGTQALCKALEQRGRKAFLVGGCVRNALLDEPVADIDLATDATPDEVQSVASSVGFKAVPTGIEHGTVTVIAHDRPHEVTTFRRDVATDGRHAVIAFSNDLTEDARRRDFTMNALYADRSGNVFDPVGGLPDVLARRVRFVGDPVRRIREDYLRILRFFRFYAQYGDVSAGIDEDGLRACADSSAGLDGLSRERVGAETRKLLSAPDPGPTLSAMAEAGVLQRVITGADLAAFARLRAVEGNDAVDWQRRLACLATGAGLDLRLSRSESRRIAEIRSAAGTDLSPAALGWKMGQAAGKGAVMVRSAISGLRLPEGWKSDVDRGAAARFPIRASDLAPLAGAELGRRLRDLEERWLRSDLRLTREELLR